MEWIKVFVGKGTALWLKTKGRNWGHVSGYGAFVLSRDGSG